MAIRTFLFCDICNPQAIRHVEAPSKLQRRSSDARAWYEGSAQDAAAVGWSVTATGEHHCPRCRDPKIEAS
jgi:hypothetical protein